ncbi:MAG: hypothetical protein ACRECP_04230 [Methylocella sp.]
MEGSQATGNAARREDSQQKFVAREDRSPGAHNEDRPSRQAYCTPVACGLWSYACPVTLLKYSASSPSFTIGTHRGAQALDGQGIFAADNADQPFRNASSSAIERDEIGFAIALAGDDHRGAQLL